MEYSVESSLGTCLTASYQMDAPLQNTLKRVSREIQVRKNGSKDSKQPLPPMYEMVGNSIAYQLLLQSHPDITVDLINSVYPVLKNLQTSTQWLYIDYIESFKSALIKKATPQCLHPADGPTVKFLVDLCVHASSIPLDEKTNYISPTPSLWMNLLAIFSASSQNQKCLVDYRCASKVVGCMNLTSMADDIKLQCYGWVVLGHILLCPPNDITKPAVHIQAITLLLGHIRQQCEQFYHDDNLMKSILKFLTQLTSTTRACSLSNPFNESNTPVSYTKGDALQISILLEEAEIRKLLLDLPEHLQDDMSIKSMLQSVLLSLAPTIQSRPDHGDDSIISCSVAIRQLPVPPPKPKRSKIRSQYFTKEEVAGIPRSPRKLPDVPIKRMSFSKSSENIQQVSAVVGTAVNAEYSLPVGIITTSKLIKKDNNNKTNKSNITSKPRSLTTTTTSTTNDNGPAAQLTHYNRVSLKRTRGSYIKAVTSSQKVYGQDTSNNIEYIVSQITNGCIEQALVDRKEMISNIMQLWKNDKALQASSNLVMCCFYNGDADLPLFVDCLQCICAYPSQWSLGICIVLLPYIRRITTSDYQLRYLETVNCSISLIMKRFAVIILGIKHNKQHTSRVHLEQRQACYHELHLLFATITKLEITSSNEQEIEKIIKILSPFNEPMS